MFSLNKFTYKQRDGVSKGSSFGPILANGIMIKLEKKILPSLTESGKLKFYMRYTDGMLLLAKNDDIKYIFNKFNSFHKNLKLIIDRSEDNNMHFSEITIGKTDTDSYYKPTYTG